LKGSKLAAVLTLEGPKGSGILFTFPSKSSTLPILPVELLLLGTLLVALELKGEDKDGEDEEDEDDVPSS